MGYVGYRAGIPSELLKLLGVVTGFFVGYWLYQTVGEFIARWSFLSLQWANCLALVGVIVVGYFGVTRLIGVLDKVIKVSVTTKLNAFGGIVVGLFRAVFVASIVLIVCLGMPSAYLKASVETYSFSGPSFSRIAPSVYNATRPWLRSFWYGIRGKG